jgi:RNA polymerase sigma-70 factor (ECF subfamily)
MHACMTSSSDDLRRDIAALLPRLRRFGIALAGSVEQGDDIVQAAIERVLVKSDQWQLGTSLESWTFKIMQNLWRDELRRRRTDERKQALNSAATDDMVDGSNVAESMLMLNKTRACFTQLPEDQRLALALVVLDGQSYRDAAHQLDIPIGTLMSRLSRGRDALRRMMEDEKTPPMLTVHK